MHLKYGDKECHFIDYGINRKKLNIDISLIRKAEKFLNSSIFYYSLNSSKRFL